MWIRVHLEAEADLLEAHDFLQNGEAGMAEAFQTEVARTFGMLIEFPKLGRALGPVRSVLTRVFRYRIIYQVAADHIVILAVAHQSRDEAFWYKRL